MFNNRNIDKNVLNANALTRLLTNYKYKLRLPKFGEIILETEKAKHDFRHQPGYVHGMLPKLLIVVESLCKRLKSTPVCSTTRRAIAGGYRGPVGRIELVRCSGEAIVAIDRIRRLPQQPTVESFDPFGQLIQRLSPASDIPCQY